MKLMILGNARHGKDSVSEILCRDFGLSFVSSSQFVADRAVKPWLADRGITYGSFEAMYEDRVNHRAAWFNAISAYNGNDPARLARELLTDHDIYCGMRCERELAAVHEQKLVDYTIWVDASKRLPPEPSSSMTVTKEMADWVIDNNGPVEALRGEVIEAWAAVRRAPVRRPKLTPELAAEIRAYGAAFPDASYLEISQALDCNSGRISEALAGFREDP